MSPPPADAKLDPRSASMRAALAPEAEHDDDDGGAADDRPARPEGLFFRSSPEEVTVSAPGTQPEMARTTSPADEQELATMEQTFAHPADELLRTSEGAALDFLDSTLARPPKLSDPVSTDTGEIPAATASAESDEDFEEEVIIADDLAEMIDAEEEHAPPEDDVPPEDPKPKRSVPPPIPRQ
jgi:hypothetical protein